MVMSAQLAQQCKDNSVSFCGYGVWDSLV